MSTTIRMNSQHPVRLENAEMIYGDLIVSALGKASQGTVAVSEWLKVDSEAKVFYLEITPAIEKDGSRLASLSEGESSIVNYGRADLFGKEDGTPEIKLGYQFRKEDGCFRVAVKFKSTMINESFRLHYVWMGATEGNQEKTVFEVLPEEVTIAEEMPAAEAAVPEEPVVEIRDEVLQGAAMEVEDIAAEDMENAAAEEIEDTAAETVAEEVTVMEKVDISSMPEEMKAMDALLQRSLAGGANVREVPQSDAYIEKKVPVTPFYIANPPKMLHPGWKYALWTNMDPRQVPIRWTVEEGQGTITSFGEYTAPMVPGVYEVKAFRADNDQMTSVYIVVRG